MVILHLKRNTYGMVALLLMTEHLFKNECYLSVYRMLIMNMIGTKHDIRQCVREMALCKS